MIGCFNRQEYLESFGKWALDSKTGEIKWYEVKNTLSKPCQFILTSYDKRCEGCKWNKGKKDEMP